MTEHWKGRAVTALQYGIGLAALAWVFSGVDWDRFRSLLGQLAPPVVALVILVTVIGLVMRFFTWRVLLDRIDPTGIAEAGRIDLAINFINQLFPSRLSGRSIAPLIVRQRTGIRWAEAVAITGVHTGLYAIFYGVVALLGFGLAWSRLSSSVLAIVALSAALYLVAGVAVLLAGVHFGTIEKLIGLVEWIAERLPLVGGFLASIVEKAPEFADESASQFRSLVSDPGTILLYAVGWGGAMIVAPGLRVFLLLDGFGSPFTPAVLLPIYLLMAYSVTLLPLTPGGIGISEATATLVFVSLGVPQSIIVPVIFLDRLLGVYLPALAGSLPATRLDFSELVP